MFRNVVKKVVLGLFAYVSVGQSYGQSAFNIIEVGQATLSAYSTTASDLTPFETIDFNAHFPAGTTPNVFVLTPEFGSDAAGGTGDDSCGIRITNVTNTGFDAVCLEPRNENRSSESVSFDYIAIQSGQTEIPTSSGGTVTFVSECASVNNQVYSTNNCDNCDSSSGPAFGFQSVSFPTDGAGDPLFTDPPVLLAQMTSVNNVLTADTSSPATYPAGEPEFFDVGYDDITASGFGVAIERLEAGNGTISMPEDICYLAVEEMGCTELDLSGDDGSIAAVNFQSLIGGDNIVGHDNGAAVGGTFDAACFSTPPIAVASKRRRDGPDGAVLRVTDVTATNISLIVDEDQVSDPDRSHTDEPTSIIAFAEAFTTPVTLSRVEISQSNRQVTFDWQTSAESFHLGFHLWGETQDGWVQLNKALIPGFGANTDRANTYQQTLRLSREHRDEVTSFGISTVDTSGFEEFFGPFQAGEEYGEADTSEAIDWTTTRKQFNISMRQRGFTKVNTRWRKLSDHRAARRNQRQHARNANGIEVTFDQPGMHQISLQDILDVRPDWEGKDTGVIAVTLNGQSVTRRVFSDDASVSADDHLVFNVSAPQGADDLYLSNYVYRIRLGRHFALDAAHVDAAMNNGSAYENEPSEIGYTELRLTSDKQYSAAQNTGSPWYDTQLFTLSTPVTQTYSFNVTDDSVSEHEGRLRFQFFGSLDLPGDDADHHVQIRVNGELVHDQLFDGLVTNQGEVDLAVGVLQTGANQVDVTLPGDTGLLADIVLIDEISVLIPHKLNTDTALSFIPDHNASHFRVSDVQAITETVFAHTSNGGFTSLDLIHEPESQSAVFSALPFVNSSTNSVELKYSVANVSSLPTASTMAVADLPDQDKIQALEQADLMIVAHPSFIGETLDDYIKFKQDNGNSISLVDWLDLVAQFGHGNDTPTVLDNYLLSLDASLRPKHVLIVGGHTFDYKDQLGQGMVNFIPAHYRAVGMFEYTPSDNVFADIDEDNLPDLAIGRWPVRTQEDLTSIVEKSIAWQTLSTGDMLADNVLLIAQENDGLNLNFESSLEGNLISNLNHQTGILDVNRVYLSEINTESPIQSARDTITENINDGTRLVSFAGHASNAGWGFQGIVNTSTIQALENVGKPTVVMPLACYTTDYQTLSTNTLAHQWMFAGQQGAVAVHGATSLGEYRNNGIFAKKVMKASQQAKTLGEAILNAKRSMAPVNQILHNWALLGDPSIPTP